MAEIVPDPFSTERWWNEATQTYDVPGVKPKWRIKPRRECHYCRVQTREWTRDHIVPQSRMVFWTSPRMLETANDRGSLNIVYACRTCNETKADLRSDCDCQKCVDAWELLGPRDWRLIERVKLCRR